jgi:hypothetical protein
MARATALSPVVTAFALALSACATARVYSEQELALVADRCGVAAGEVMQEPDHPRFLFLYAVGPTREQLDCVQRWSRRRNMHLSYIEAIDFAGDNAQAH